MTQLRIWNYGDTFTSVKGTQAHRALHAPGVYTGFDIVITDTDSFELYPGFLMLPSGVIVGEDRAIPFIISPMSSAPRNYTIVVRHVDVDVMGGSPAIYTLETGILRAADITDGIPLAWLQYPGGSVPLQDYFFTSSLKLASEASDSICLTPSNLLPPLDSKWVISSLGPNSTFSSGMSAGRPMTRLETDGLGPTPPAYESSTVVLPLIAHKFRPVSVTLRALISPTASVAVSVLDTDNNPVTLGSSILSPSPVFSDFVVSVDPSSGVFTQGDIYSVLIEFRTPGLEFVELQLVSVQYDPLP